MPALFQKITSFLQEVKIEMKKVDWPTREETLRKTGIVIAVSVVTALFLGALDLLFNWIMQQII